MPGIPFDDAHGVVPNEYGRVNMESAEINTSSGASSPTASAAPSIVLAPAVEGAATQGVTGALHAAGSVSSHHHQQQQQQHVYSPLPQHQQQQQHGVPLQGSSSSSSDGAVYVVGWLKRGPTGIIGTNAVDADETVACIAEVG